MTEDAQENRNPADVLQEVFERVVPPHLREPGYQERFAELREYCEQPVTR